MDSLDAGLAPASRLRAEVTCPNCWFRFQPDTALFIARHESMIGDEVAGPSAYRRFAPTRFNLAGDALDARGIACQQLACPRCHLEVVRSLFEFAPFFISVVGAPSSGKSYFLAAMTWGLRSLGPRLGFHVSDSDPAANFELQRYEELLFVNPHPQTPVALRKTEIQGGLLYQSVLINGQAQSFPRPFQFNLSPTPEHQRHNPRCQPLNLVMYDNAGEHFLPGSDMTSTPVTLHLAESAALCFLFDPVQDPRFRARCHGNDPQLTLGTRPDAEAGVSRQEIILNEMIARVRRYKGMSQIARHPRPLIMLLAKADLWIEHERFDQEPLIAGEPWRLDTVLIDRVSSACRAMLLDTCPEIVSAAEGFSVRVLYLPVSALGGSPELVDTGKARFYGIRPANIRPKWATVPILWALSQLTRDMVLTGAGDASPSGEHADG